MPSGTTLFFHVFSNRESSGPLRADSPQTSIQFVTMSIPVAFFIHSLDGSTVAKLGDRAYTSSTLLEGASPSSAIDVDSDEDLMVEVRRGCTLSLVHKACTPCR